MGMQTRGGGRRLGGGGGDFSQEGADAVWRRQGGRGGGVIHT